jgi:predicted secreted Zn-dependent protease
MSDVIHSSFEPLKPNKISRLFQSRVAFGFMTALLVCLLLTISALQLTGLRKQPLAAADTLQVTPSQKHEPQVRVVSNTGIVSQPAPGAPVHVTAPTPVCTPFKASTLPSSISLTNKADGLTKLVDSPQHYQVYGNNPATIRAQIRQCAPKSGNGATEYAAETSYHITWQYNVVDAGEGKCQIAHAKVGVHVAQVMPLWQPSLDVQYAQTLLDDLNSFPATSCAQLAQAVKYLTDSDIAILDQANDNYDSSTNHGATQGAILP